MNQSNFNFSNKASNLSTNNDKSEGDNQSPLMLSVSQLNRAIKSALEGEFVNFWLKGELSNFTAHSSGHWYFTLKDKKSQMSGVMFRGSNSSLKFKPHTGMEVIVRGRVTVYEPRGNYQILCEYMEPAGVGALQQAYEQLKAKLQQEGLFDQAHKKPIPVHPNHIAVVTSPTGAAIRDILNVLKRRYRSAKVTVIPTVVQGEKAAPFIVKAIESAAKLKHVDVLIVGRGGGSMEDLWCFNDESVVRAIYACPIAVICAVGHEIDFTIADFVADLRAATPSAAAELVAKNSIELMQQLKSSEKRLSHLYSVKHNLLKQKLVGLNKRLVDPRKSLNDLAQRLDDLTLRLTSVIKNQLTQKKLKVNVLRGQLVNPKHSILTLKQKLHSENIRLQNIILNQLATKQQKLGSTTQLLDSMSPLTVVDRGYAITTHKGQVVRSVTQVKAGDLVDIKVSDGVMTAELQSIKTLKSPTRSNHGF